MAIPRKEAEIGSDGNQNLGLLNNRYRYKILN